jgi:hypothetical protein
MDDIDKLIVILLFIGALVGIWYYKEKLFNFKIVFVPITKTKESNIKYKKNVNNKTKKSKKVKIENFVETEDDEEEHQEDLEQDLESNHEDSSFEDDKSEKESNYSSLLDDLSNMSDISNL